MRKALFIFLCAAVTLAQGQAYPSKPIRLIVPFASGRQLGVRRAHRIRRDGKGLGQNFVVGEQGGRRRQYRDGRSGARPSPTATR